MDLELYQLDIRTVFFNGELNEDIYMDQPLGFETKGQELKVCKLLDNGTSSFIKLSLRMVLQ
jgi:hypothetical protein